MKWLEKWTWHELATFAFVAIALSTFSPWFPKINSANELSRLYLTRAMISPGTLQIDAELKAHGNIADKAKKDGHFYSEKAPGSSLLAVPPVWMYRQVSAAPDLAGEMRVSRWFVSTFPTILLLISLVGFWRREDIDAPTRSLLMLVYGLGTMATTYSVLFYGHQLSGVVGFWLFLAVGASKPGDDDPKLWPSFLVGFLAGMAELFEYQNALMLAPLGVWFVWNQRKNWRGFLAGFLGILGPALVFGIYHHAAFGAPWKTGYSYLLGDFAKPHAQGFMGLKTPNLDQAWLVLFSSAKGIFWFSPFLLLALPGLILVGDKARTQAAARVALVVTFGWTLFVSSMAFPDGWTVGQRHLTPIVPWLIWAAGLAITKWRWARVAAPGLALISIFVTGGSTIVWPYYMARLKNPFFDVGLPLMEQRYFPDNLFGVNSPALALTFFLIVALAVGVYAFARQTSRTVVGTVFVTLALASFWWNLGHTIYPDANEVRTVEAIKKKYDRTPPD
ncbi:MAG: hypothetical protein R3E66_07265 [bacterium]